MESFQRGRAGRPLLARRQARLKRSSPLLKRFLMMFRRKERPLPALSRHLPLKGKAFGLLPRRRPPLCRRHLCCHSARWLRPQWLPLEGKLARRQARLMRWPRHLFRRQHPHPQTPHPALSRHLPLQGKALGPLRHSRVFHRSRGLLHRWEFRLQKAPPLGRPQRPENSPVESFQRGRAGKPHQSALRAD